MDYKIEVACSVRLKLIMLIFIQGQKMLGVVRYKVIKFATSKSSVKIHLIDSK